MSEKSPWQLMLRISGFWLFFGLFSIFSSYVYYEGTTIAFEWQKQVPLRLPGYLLWILFTPIVYAVVDSVQNDKKTIRTILYLILMCLLVSLSHRSIAFILQYKVKLVLGYAVQPFGIALREEKFFILSAMFDSVMICAAVMAYRNSMNYFRAAMEAKILSEKLLADLNAAKLQAMQMQLQPHFLFNSLHAISSFVYTEPEKADRAITLLSELLRKSLELRDASIITLQEEIDLTRRYLALQEIRFANKLHIVIEIGEDTKHVPVPVFILQPILENIMKHSVEKGSGMRNIRIESSMLNDALLLKITEDGSGFESLHEAMKNGFGLKNVYDRLHALPVRGELQIKNNVHEGTFAIEMIIPKGGYG